MSTYFTPSITHLCSGWKYDVGYLPVFVVAHWNCFPPSASRFGSLIGYESGASCVDDGSRMLRSVRAQQGHANRWSANSQQHHFISLECSDTKPTPAGSQTSLQSCRASGSDVFLSGQPSQTQLRACQGLQATTSTTVVTAVAKRLVRHRLHVACGHFRRNESLRRAFSPTSM